MTIKWILCDYGGVLADDHIPQSEAKMTALFKCDVPTLRQAITEKSPEGRAVRLDQVSERQFWESVAERITGSKRLPLSEMRLTELWSGSYALRPDVWDLLTTYWRQGIKIGIATNVDRYRERYMREAVKSVACQPAIFGSWKFRAMKPEQEYFEAVTRELNLPGSKSEILFFDDQKGHVIAAQHAGWTSFQYSDPSTMKSDIDLLLADTMKGTNR